MFFKDIPGHYSIKERLIKTVTNSRISHSQLFHGPEGSAKLALALAYARYISCTSRLENDSCGTCPSCHKYNKYVHPDLHFAFPASIRESDSESVAIDYLTAFREAVIENPYLGEFSWYEKIGMEKKQGLIGKNESHEIIRKLGLKSFESDYKILVMWLPERMNPTASNKLLKLIEEPPKGTVFLFISEEPDRLLPTILSRTQMLRIPKLKDAEVEEMLIKKFQAAPDVVKNAVRMADGNYEVAQTAILVGEQNTDNFERFINLMRLAFKKDIISLIAWVDGISGTGREKQKNFLEYSIRMLRENYMINLGKPDITHLADYEDEFSIKFSRFINEKNIEKLYEEFNLAHSHISANGYGRIVFLDLCLKIIKLLQL